LDNRTVNVYLRTICQLEEESKEVTTNEMAKRLKVKPASISEMVVKLAKEGYVTHTPYKNIALTTKGRRFAKKAVRRHRLIEDFLVRILKIKKEDACKQAELMEHALSDKTDVELCRFLQGPKKANNTIPKCNLSMSCESCLRKRN